MRLLTRIALLLLPLTVACASGQAGSRDDGRQVTRLDGAARFETLSAGQAELPESGRVIDILKGDELVLDNGTVVRLIGIDVPTADYGKRDGHFYGKAAIQLMRSRALNAEVRLGYDDEPRDRYDRALAYVYLPDGTMANELLLREGLAVAACFPPNEDFCDRFAARQAEAMGDRRGIWDFNPEDWPEAGRTDNLLEGVRVRTVLDGDTVQLEDGTVVRLIAIDAPESEEVWKEGAYGHESWRAMRDLVDGKSVTLEYDVEFSDPRGRELAWLWVGEGDDRVLVNAEMVRQGWAWVAVFPPNVRHVRTLFEAQTEAYKTRRGLWAQR